MICKPHHGTCHRIAYHTGSHSQLTEREYQLSETKRLNVVLEAESKYPWCRDPLNLNKVI